MHCYSIPTGGRLFNLGSLYNARCDDLIPGLSPWSNETLANHRKDVVRRTTYRYEEDKSIVDQARLLDISGDLMMSYFGGFVELGGSGSYLSEPKSSIRKERISLCVSVSTEFRQLTMEQLNRNAIEISHVLEDDIGATHVVTGIQYGANFVCVSENNID